MGLGYKKPVAHLSGPFAERPHCLNIIDNMPGRLGHKTPGFANRSWRGNVEPAQPEVFAEMRSLTPSSRKLTFRRTGSHKPSDYSHKCSHSQRHIPSFHLTMYTWYRLTCLASIHIYTPVHTLKPRKTQVVMQFTWGHTAIFHVQTLIHMQAMEAPHFKAKGSSVHFPASISLLTCVLLEILVQNVFPLSMLSEGSQPYAYYKNSAHVSDSGRNKMQPTYVYTWQQEPECSSHCGMEGSFRESPGTRPGRADSAWTSLANSFPKADLMLHWLRGPEL